MIPTEEQLDQISALPRMDLPQAMTLLRDAVAEHGPDTHRSAEYLIDNQPCCIVGEVLHRNGVPVECLELIGEAVIVVPLNRETALAEFVEVWGEPTEGNRGAFLADMYEHLFWSQIGDRPARQVLRTAQARQDKGLNWGEALAAAEGLARTLANEAPADA